MNSILDRRLKALEQDRPDSIPVMVWLHHGEDAGEVRAKAQLAHPGRPVMLVSWLPPQAPQYQMANDRPQL